jgi:hypothetical protein
MSHHCPIAKVIPAPEVFLRNCPGSEWFLWVFKNPEDFDDSRRVVTGTLKGGTEVVVLKRMADGVTPLVKVRARHRDANGKRVTGWMLECNVTGNRE